jgi:hypothetical protein
MALHGSIALGELSVDPQEGESVSTILMAIGDEPSPIDPLGWQPIRSTEERFFLNPTGADRGDGRPDIAWMPESGRPVVAWSYRRGHDYDIAFSEWTGDRWSDVHFLTNSPEEDLEPRITVAPDGTLHVTWWIPHTIDRVFLCSRPAGETEWTDPVLITPDPMGGRRPSAAVHDGVVRIAYERTTGLPGLSQQAVVGHQLPEGGFRVDVVGMTERSERLDVLLSAESGRLWVTWKQDADLFGYAVHDEADWSPMQTEPWTDPGWIGVEEIRRTIRRTVLN